MRLSSEQVVWILTLTRQEKRTILRHLETREWMLEWNAETHEFELKPVE